MKSIEFLSEIDAWHGTLRPRISRFKPLSHFGSEKAALDRIAYIKHKLYKDAEIRIYLYKLDLGITAPGIVKDYVEIQDPPGSMKKIALWSKDLLKDTRIKSYIGRDPINGNKNVSGENIAKHFIQMSSQLWWAENYSPLQWIKLWTNFLESVGIDGLVYRNQVEDSGSKSYITFSPDKVKILGRPKVIDL